MFDAEALPENRLEPHSWMRKSHVDLTHIEGWLSPSAQTATEYFVPAQVRMGAHSGMLELGIHRGKYLALLSCLSEGRPVVGVDAFLNERGDRLGAEDEAEATRVILANVASVSIWSPQIVSSFTCEAVLNGSFSFIHVDAGHSALDAAFDLALADRHLTDGGVIAMDDVFSARTPGVAEGLFRYFRIQRDLAPFAACGNKVFFSRKEWHSRYLGVAGQTPLRVETAEMLGCPIAVLES